MRYTVTLNAPAAVTKQPGNLSISYVNQDVVYQLSILDTEPKSDTAHQYCTFVRLSQDLDSSAQTTEGNCPHSVIYVPYPQDSVTNPSSLPRLSSCSKNSFSVSWQSNAVTGGSYCLIPLRFKHTSGARETKLKLFVGTERICVVDTNLAKADGYEESCGHIRLFTNGDADAVRISELSEVAQQLVVVNLATAQASADEDETSLQQRHKDNVQAGLKGVEKRTMQKRKALGPDPVSATIPKGRNIPRNRPSAIDRPLMVRPVQVFCPTTAMRGRSRPMHVLPQQTKHSTGTMQVHPFDVRAVTPATKLEAATQHPVKQPKSAVATTSKIEMSGPTSVSNQNRAGAPICLYVRQEQSAGARYTAVYLSELTLSNLLDAISLKLQVPISEIGTISYIDHHKMRVPIGESTIKLLVHEQDLLVWLPWRVSFAQGSSTDGDHAFHDPGSVDSSPPGTQPANIKSYEAVGLLSHDQPNEFDDLLNYQPDDSCSPTIDSGTDNGNDNDILSVSEMFALCSTNTTSASSIRSHLTGDSLQHQICLGRQGIDHLSYEFDGVSETFSPSLPSPHSPNPSWFLDVNESFASTLQPTIAGLLPHNAFETMTIYNPTPPLPASYEPPVTRKYSSRANKTQRSTPSAPKMAKQEKVYSTVPEEKNPRERDALERNRVAASNCRIKRKDKEARLQAQSRKGELLNEKLKAEVQLLEAEVAIAQEMLKEHVDCS